MAASKRQRILEAFRTRLQAITTAGGFDTDAGQNVFLGEVPELGENDADAAIALIVGEDEPSYNGENVFVTLPIEIQALAKADLDEPWIAAEQVLADVKRAVELEDRTLGGLVPRRIERGSTRAVPREPGMTTVGVAITYTASFKEQWGNP